jgi:hypothetical protein
MQHSIDVTEAKDLDGLGPSGALSTHTMNGPLF